MLPDHAARPDRTTSGSGDLLDTYSRFSSVPSRRGVVAPRAGKFLLVTYLTLIE